MELLHPRLQAMLDDASRDPEAFWARAAQALPWRRTWDSVFDWDPEQPDADGRYFRWYVGAETNLGWCCVDHHVERGRGGVAALVCHDERGGRNTLTYAQLLHEVRRAARGLRALGIGRGDRVAIYMPTCAEAIVLMLACVRIGAIHLVVFAGFGAGALGDRIRMAGARVLFCANAVYRKGAAVPLTAIVHDALASAPSIERVVVLERAGAASSRPEGHLSWEDFLAAGNGHSDAVEWLEANEPAFILATSGTTAKPKLAVHSHGGYAVYIAAMARWAFGMSDADVWWSTSDIGWIVGHSYIVYAPLLMGCTTLAYEGALDHPDPATLYRIVETDGVTGVFTSPTAVRLLMRHGAEAAAGHVLSSLTRVVCAGEVLNVPAWRWLQKEVLGDRVPVIDHMWQTETGGPLFANPWGLGMIPIKPGSAGVPMPGIEAEIVTPEGKACAEGEKGMMVIRRPFPGLTSTLWGEVARYADDYWRRVPGRTVYLTGDAAEIDADGYVWFSGRADEIIKIADHRVGTIEVETAFMRHPAVAECGVTGRPDEVRGHVIAAFVVLRRGFAPDATLERELRETVRAELGPVAVIGEVNFVTVLPKTRSGKIMRRVLKAIALGEDPGDISTIEDEASVDEIREAWQAVSRAVPLG